MVQTFNSQDMYVDIKNDAGGIKMYGGWLSGNEIKFQVKKGGILIDPYDDNMVNPNSYNYHLGYQIIRLKNDILDLKEKDEFEEIDIPEDGFVLLPGECYLGITMEKFGSNKYASLITGRSSIGRKFVTNHITAGLIDQGFFGNITLEIMVNKPTRVYAGIVFGQIFWFTVYGEPLLYCGKYQNQQKPTISRIYRERKVSTTDEKKEEKASFT